MPDRRTIPRPDDLPDLEPSATWDAELTDREIDQLRADLANRRARRNSRP